MLDNHQTVQTVKSPTRYGETTATLIDHVITPITLECESFVVNAAISDHLPVVTYIYPSTHLKHTTLVLKGKILNLRRHSILRKQ